MKHLKTYESLNENFIFAVNIENITTDQVYQIIDKLNIEFPDFNEYSTFDFRELITQIKVPQFRYNIPCALVFNVYYFVDKKNVSINRIVTRGWGAGYDYMENILSLEEFLNNNIDDIKVMIDTKKYNL